jgi:hypothetical protein
MPRFMLSVLFAALIAVLLSPVPRSVAAPPESLTKPMIAEAGEHGFVSLVNRGYTPLFNGTDLTG